MNLPTSIHCGQALMLIDHFIDGELPHEVTPLLDAHLKACPKCVAHLNFEKSLKESVQRSCVSEPAPDKLRQRVIQQLSTQRVEWVSGYIVSQTFTIEIHEEK